MQSFHTHAADKLNELLRGEISAVETYDKALDKIVDPTVRNELVDAKCCHAGRVDVLTRKIVELGGEPSHDSGVWGAVAKALQGGATAFGDKAAVAVLEQGEDNGLNNYRNLLSEPDVEVQLVVQTLMPRQEHTHEKLSALKHRLQ